jgi:hypothetical protein
MKIGTKLNNGAIVLAAKPEFRSATRIGATVYVVLCWWDHGGLIWRNSTSPFVTWKVDEVGMEAYLGHYFEDIEEAVANYQERS